MSNDQPLRLEPRDALIAKEASPAMAAIRHEAIACMQCGTCTGSCPVAHWMDYGPRGIFALLEAYQYEEVLASETIWVCATCYSCSARCPRDIPITSLMAEMREEAIRLGFRPWRDVTYNQDFLHIVRRHGRMFEVELMVRFGRVDPLGLVTQAPVGLKMLNKGRLAFTPCRIEGRQELQRLFEHFGGGEAE
jgi:heterodisulfide reductase subunit C